MEFKQWLINEELYPQNNIAVVYHKTPTVENLRSILQNGFTKMERGTYGAGLYSYYKYDDNFSGNFNPTSVGGYGNIIIKMKVSNLDQFLVLVEEEAKRIHGKDWLPSAQIKKLNIKVPPGYAEALDEAMQGLTLNRRHEKSEGNPFDNARGITMQKLGPLMQKTNVHDLLASKWASSGGDDLSKYRKTTAENPMANQQNKRISAFAWDAPLAAADSNCKGVIFYDPWSNGGHNLLKYPPFNDIELLAYAFIPTSYGVPEKDLEWHDIKRFNANFAKNIGTFNPKMTTSFGQQPPDVDPTNTAFQHDKLKIPQWGYDVAGINTATGTYVGKPMRGQLSHNDTVKASNDLLNLLKLLKNQKTLDDYNKNTQGVQYKGILAEILKNIKILTNFDSPENISKYLTKFKKLFDLSGRARDRKDVEDMLRFYSDKLDQNQLNNLMTALVDIMPVEYFEKMVDNLLKPEIDLKYWPDGRITAVDNRNQNSPVKLFKNIDIYKFIDLLNKKNVSEDTLAKFVRYVDDQDKLQELLGHDKYKKLLSNKNVNANPIDPQDLPYKGIIGMGKFGRKEGIDLLKLKHRNGIEITDDDIYNLMNSEDRNQNRLFDFLREIKYPIKPTMVANAMSKLSGKRLIAFVDNMGPSIIQYLDQLDPEFVKKSNLIGTIEKALLFRDLIGHEKFKQFEDAAVKNIHSFLRNDNTSMKDAENYANENPDKVSRSSWGRDTLHKPTLDRFSPYRMESVRS